MAEYSWQCVALGCKFTASNRENPWPRLCCRQQARHIPYRSPWCLSRYLFGMHHSPVCAFPAFRRVRRLGAWMQSLRMLTPSSKTFAGFATAPLLRNNGPVRTFTSKDPAIRIALSKHPTPILFSSGWQTIFRGPLGMTAVVPWD